MRFEVEHQIERGDTPVLLNVIGESAGNTGLRVNVLDGSWCARVDLEWRDGAGFVLLYRKKGQDLAARDDQNEPIVLVPVEEDLRDPRPHTNLLWECVCGFYHPKTRAQCARCSARREEMPPVAVAEAVAWLKTRVSLLSELSSPVGMDGLTVEMCNQWLLELESDAKNSAVTAIPNVPGAPVRVLTTSLFWDCECEKDYIHRRGALVQCPVCHAEAEEMPDARVNETLVMLDEKIASYQRDLDSGLVTLRAGWLDVISMFKSWRAQVAQGE